MSATAAKREADNLKGLIDVHLGEARPGCQTWLAIVNKELSLYSSIYP